VHHSKIDWPMTVKAAIERTSVDGSNVPQSDICTAANNNLFDNLVGGYEQARRH
jgi:hypothetical protein